MKRTKFSHRVLSVLLCAALLISYVPLTSGIAKAALRKLDITGTVVDAGTADGWETMLGTHGDGNRYAGRVWVDRSVYKDGDTVVLNSRGESGSSFRVALEEDEAFQVVFSALGSTMTSKESTISTGPMDVVLILDNSVSMNTVSGGTTRMQKVIESANSLLADLLDGHDVRLGITAYSEDASTVLPFGTYKDGVVLKVNSYTGTGSRNGVITACNKNGQTINSNYKSAGYANYTNTQAGFNLAMQMLADAENTAGRKPVVILLTDGAANTAVDTLFDRDKNGTVRQVYYSNDIDPMIALSTLLSAAYQKATVEDHYGKAPMIYGIGVDLSATDGSNAVIDPKNNFNGSNRNAHIREAYQTYVQTWLKGDDVTVSSGTGSGWGSTRYSFRFGHEYPQNSAVTDKDIAANINYVDTYYSVAAASLEEVFDQIYEELSSSVFNPISSSTTSFGGTGVDDTPLVYVDFIGQYMQIKEIQSVTLFGASYGVVRNADGTYTVNAATGINPTTNEAWNTAEDILISVTKQANGTQKLEIRINQEILPIILEQVVSETVGDVTVSTITELKQDPLRIYYTVGMDPDILLPNGEIDVSKIQGYPYINDQDGTVSFYGSQFGVMNPADSAQIVWKGDAHVGFQPSVANRYYYYQTNQGIFTKVTNKSDGTEVTIPSNDGYGILWDASKYDLTWMTYEEYLNAQDTDEVYTYVTYYRPTPDTTDAANAAEEVTYLVNTEWKYLKDSVAFYDAAAGVYLNNGAAIPQDQVAAAIAEYKQSNPNAELFAVLGVGSRRTSRLHNMTVNKLGNNTNTAVESYSPEYLEEKSLHNDNDVVVWLGNNGKMTVKIDTGIALTKAVTESIGNADDTYALTVTIPAGVVAAPEVVDAEGTAVTSTYSGNVLTVHVKAGQTVYVSGIPGGTECAIGEIVDGDYYIESKTDKVTVPLVSEVLNGMVQFAPAVVTNAPNKYGNLYITKEITGEHTVPGSILEDEFNIVVHVGTALAGKTFAVEDSMHSAPYDVTVDGAGNLTFRIKARQTIEVLRLPAGTAVTVTEVAPDSHFTVSYRTRNHSGEAADSDNVLVIPEEGSATAVILNRYTPSPVSVKLDIAGTKNFITEGSHPGGKFVYKVQKWNGTGWEDISGKTGETVYGANESGTKQFVIADVLAGITYTEVGSHSYRVIEVKGDVANVTYDRTIYTFDITVTDNGGQLVASVIDRNNNAITGGVYEVTFTNTYHTVSVSLDVHKIVENKSGDTTVSGAGFAFEAIRTDAAWNALTGADAGTFRVYSDAAGIARFTNVCTKAGTYYFLLREVNGGLPGWAYSGAEYRITVTVTEQDGDLSAVLSVQKQNSANAQEQAVIDPGDASSCTVSFVNTYDPENTSVDLDGAVSKVLTGKTLEAEMFTFFVFENDKGALRVYQDALFKGTNDLNGNVSFVDFEGVLTFDKVGIYQYDIVEYIPAGAVYDAATGKYVLNGMSYDPTIYDLVVEVYNDAATGKLKASYYFEDAVSGVVTFRNSYKATAAEYTFSGVKILHGRAPRNGEFTFALYAGSTLLETVTNKADGTFGFKTLRYTAAGTYTYTIKEVAGTVAGVRYDGAERPITVIVTVTDHNGVLSASASVSNGDIRFENTYTAGAAQVTFNGTKTLAGGTLENKAFAFRLYRTDSSFDITNASAQLLASTQNEGDSFTFARALDATGTYYFVIVEDVENPVDGIVYDRTQHRYSVQVSDIGDGQLRAMITNVTTGAATAFEASVSADVAFTNAVEEVVTKKEVYLADATTQIDGQKVNAGDILTYYITYTNYNGEDVVVDIMDAIPNHTAYVEGSASHGGTYAGTHLNWILNVSAGDSVTVSFQVEVQENDAIVANTAVVRDGVNTYSTNEVVNHTVENNLEKDVFAPADATVSIDGEKVKEGDELLYEIRFTNTSGAAIQVQITDRIPVNTTYVEGSADMGGVYTDGTIVWNIENVPAWSTVTVTFKVTVNAGIGDATIENQATAHDGVNEYATRLVTNYTVKEIEKPDGPPKLGDATDLLHWAAMMFVSGGGALTTALWGRKKKEEEE